MPYLQAGPELNFKVAGDTKINTYPVDNDGFAISPEVTTEANKSFLWAISAGIGAEYKMNRHHSMSFDLRYLKYITKDNYDFSCNGLYFTVSYNL